MIKNSTVAAIIKTQFNLSDDIEVNVQYIDHLSSYDTSHFETWWVDDVILNEATVVVPHIQVTTKRH